jgi:hypothetical protein
LRLSKLVGCNKCVIEIVIRMDLPVATKSHKSLLKKLVTEGVEIYIARLMGESSLLWGSP